MGWRGGGGGGESCEGGGLSVARERGGQSVVREREMGGLKVVCAVSSEGEYSRVKWGVLIGPILSLSHGHVRGSDHY